MTLRRLTTYLPIIVGCSTVLIAVGANRVEMSNVHDQIQQIQGLRPEAVAAAVAQSQQDVRDMKQTMNKVADDTQYSRGKLDTLDTRLNSFDQRLQSLESRIDKHNP